MKVIGKVREWNRLRKLSCTEGGNRHSWHISPRNPSWPSGLVGTPFGDIADCDNCDKWTYVNEPTR